MNDTCTQIRRSWVISCKDKIPMLQTKELAFVISNHGSPRVLSTYFRGRMYKPNYEITPSDCCMGEYDWLDDKFWFWLEKHWIIAFSPGDDIQLAFQKWYLDAHVGLVSTLDVRKY